MVAGGRCAAPAAQPRRVRKSIAWWLLLAGLLGAIAGSASAAAAPATAARAPATAGITDPPGSYGFRSYGVDQGLRNQAVTSLAQDGLGFLYAGTEDGLFRYDGASFLRLGVAEGLPGDAVALLHATGHGRLWVATKEGLVAWDGAAGKPLGPVHLRGREVLGIASADDGTMLVATTTGVFESTPARPALHALVGLPRKPGAVWLSSDGGTALVAVDRRLYQREGGGAWRARDLPATHAGQAVQAIVRDGRGRIWLRGRQMLLRLAGFVGAAEDLGPALPGAAVQKGELTLDRAGRIWAPSNHGIACFDGDRRSLVDVEHGLPQEWATTVLVDREGSLWVASEGVHRLLGRFAWTAYTRRQGLPSDTVWGVFRDRAGTLWAATNSGIARAGAHGWDALPMDHGRSFYAFAESPAGDLWVGGNTGEAIGNTLLLRPAGSAQFRRVSLASARGNSTVNSLAYGPDGALYVATMAHGLHRLQARGDGFDSQAVALPGGSASEQVNALARGSDGRLWAAGMRGVAVFDGQRWRRLGLAQGLLELETETVAPADAAGAVWISYWNRKGLTRLQISPSGAVSVRQVGQPPALVADTIYSTGHPRAGGVWLGTAMGIKRWQGRRVERFGRADGLPGDDAAANGYWGDANGDAWFGMANGLAHFDARREPATSPPPPSRITALQDGAGRALAGARPQVAWADRALGFDFAVLSYRDPARLQRQVRLLGLESDWRDTNIGEARYTGLLPGDYRFEVRARFDGGAFGPIASRDVRILPPWWLRWWFLVLAALTALAALAALLRWRTGQLSRRNAQLEALVASRTHDLQVANAALEEASMVDPLTGLKNRRFLTAFMPEEIAQCLRLQSGRSARARDGDSRNGDSRNVDLCLLMVDLDHFKSVNDTYGHAAGDAVLRQVAQVLRHACRASDVVVRWGGEEFLILARNVDREQVHVLAEQVCGAMRSHRFELDNGVQLRKTCSLGFAVFPMLPDAPDRFRWEETAELADQCLYAAKQAGRDGWVGCLLGAPGAPGGASEPDPGPGQHADIAGHGPGRLVTSFADAQAISLPPSTVCAAK